MCVERQNSTILMAGLCNRRAADLQASPMLVQLILREMPVMQPVDLPSAFLHWDEVSCHRVIASFKPMLSDSISILR